MARVGKDGAPPDAASVEGIGYDGAPAPGVDDHAGPSSALDIMRRWSADDLLVTLGHLKTHRKDGKSAPHKPLALVWAIARLGTGHGRLFRWDEFRAGVGAVLGEFGHGQVTPQYPFWHLRSAERLWETHGLDEEPTARDGATTAGFTAEAAAVLRDPITRDRALATLATTYLGDVDGNALRRFVGLATLPGAERVLRDLEGTGVGPDADAALVQYGLDRLRADGSVSVDDLGDAVTAVLLTRPGTRLEDGRVVVRPLGRPTRRDYAVFDGKALATYRKEQGELRRLLIGDGPTAECALCRRVFPVDLLVAAHVKKRAECTDDERGDLENVAMLACSLGCDRLYELGYLAVDADGTVLVHGTDGFLDGRAGVVAGVDPERSGPYFQWHREHVFRGLSEGLATIPQ
ncbi:hypothetical protein [Saccharothrix violaceirubra]|uniref:ScoMcrA-like DNA sulfur-binding domain-containing protein n=1 Tax=Saccharothrix violaceirubra TaxID=413306 RepID=A0A7W7T0E5_9PSEU|nr:hypothetical protein [Saccharothrix violaceirubra]MBB4964283.1 hypothetical protein [Saccharothrix violaceirubra]